MTQDSKTSDSRPDRKPDDTASPIDSPERAADVVKNGAEAEQQGEPHRVGESGVGAQRDEASEFTTPTGDGNYQKVGDRNVSISGEDEVQQ